MSKNKQIKAILNLVLKILVSIGSIGYLIYLLGFKKADMVTEVKTFFLTQQFSYEKLLLLLFLMLLNWGTEVYKWRLLVRSLFPMTWGFAIKTQLCSIAGSVFTPYRIGGYFGKVALLDHEYREKGLVLQLFNAMAMFITNFFFGLLFIGFLAYGISEDVLGVDPSLISTLGFIGCGIVFVIWILFVNVNMVTVVFTKFKRTRKWMQYWEVLEGPQFKKNALLLLSVSIIRYATITYQYVLAFQVFGIDIDQYSLFLSSGVLFFIFQFLPVFNAFELGATRATVFFMILQAYGIVDEISGQDVIAMTSACFFIWVVNLAIPCVAGGFFLSKMKVLKEK